MPETRKQTISWNEFNTDARQLAEKISADGAPHGIVCVARGGLVATAIVANALNIRNVKSVAVTSYFGEQHVGTEMLGSVDDIGSGEGWIFIDDLVDSGSTIRLLRKRYPKARQAVVYARPQSKSNVDLFTKEIDQDAWLVFPWE